MGDMAEYYDDREDFDFENDIDLKLGQVMLNRYSAAKKAETRATISCPCCGKLIIKKTYNKIFCSNGRTKKGGNCKDNFWNVVDERKASYRKFK